MPAEPAALGFVGGVDVSPDGRTLFAVQVLAKTLTAIDLETNTVRRTVHLDAEPYTVLTSGDGGVRLRLVVGRRESARLRHRDARTARAASTSGEHPNAMAFSKDGDAAVRGLRQHQRGVGRGRRRGEGRPNGSRCRSIRTRRRGPRPMRWRSRPTARRCSSPMPTTTPSRSSTSSMPAAARWKGSFRPAGIRPACASIATGSGSSS